MATTTKGQRNIGGSLLPSSSPEILTPILTAIGVLQVRAVPEEDTHKLFLNEEVIAEHANGFSCRSLAERLAANPIHRDRVLDQGDHILCCGGKCDLNRLSAIMSALRYERLDRLPQKV